MKSRSVIILWAVAIVLGIIACIIQFGGNDESGTRTKLEPGDKILPDLPIRKISKVTVSKGDESTQLIRINDDTWGVVERSNYPVNYEKLRNLLGALAELEVTQGYPAESEHFPSFGLAESSEKESEQGLQILAETADHSDVTHIFLGKFSGTSRSSGRFLRNADDNSGVYAVGETFPGITAAPKDWLSTDFLEIEKIKSISVSAPDDKAFKAWELVRHPNTDGTLNERGQFKLSDMGEDEVMQLTSTNPLRNLFSYASFQDILTEEQAKKSANPDAKLKRVAKITTFDALTYTITFWPQQEKPKDPDADPRLPAAQPDHLLTVSVTAKFKEKRTPGDEEKLDVAKRLDAEHAVMQKQLKEKLGNAKAFEGRIFQVSQSIVSPLQKSRADFVKSTEKSDATNPPSGIPGLPQPGAFPIPSQP